MNLYAFCCRPLVINLYTMKHLILTLCLTLYTTTSAAVIPAGVIIAGYAAGFSIYVSGILNKYHRDNQSRKNKIEFEEFLFALEESGPPLLESRNPLQISSLHAVLLKEMQGSNLFEATHLMSTRVNNLEENLPQVIEVLVRKGEGVNVRDINGNTPLHYAAKFDHSEEVLRTLIVNGADVYAENNEGETPLDLAYDYLNNQAAIDVLGPYF